MLDIVERYRAITIRVAAEVLGRMRSIQWVVDEKSGKLLERLSSDQRENPPIVVVRCKGHAE